MEVVPDRALMARSITVNVPAETKLRILFFWKSTGVNRASAALFMPYDFSMECPVQFQKAGAPLKSIRSILNPIESAMNLTDCGVYNTQWRGK